MEEKFVTNLKKRLEKQPSERLAVGAGDDAAVLLTKNLNTVITVDLLTEGVDFLWGAVSPEQIGRKALAVNLSDLAAMGAVPHSVVVALAVPNTKTWGENAKENSKLELNSRLNLKFRSNLSVELNDESFGFESKSSEMFNISETSEISPEEKAQESLNRIYDGIFSLANEFQVAVAGGDTNSWDGKLVISITAIGTVSESGPMLRKGALPGDAVVVSGSLGGSLLERQFSFLPRIREALYLNEYYDIHACMDISDGLLLDLSRLMKESDVGFQLFLSDIPIADDAVLLAEWFECQNAKREKLAGLSLNNELAQEQLFNIGQKGYRKDEKNQHKNQKLNHDDLKNADKNKLEQKTTPKDDKQTKCGDESAIKVVLSASDFPQMIELDGKRRLNFVSEESENHFFDWLNQYFMSRHLLYQSLKEKGSLICNKDKIQLLNTLDLNDRFRVFLTALCCALCDGEDFELLLAMPWETAEQLVKEQPFVRMSRFFRQRFLNNEQENTEAFDAVQDKFHAERMKRLCLKYGLPFPWGEVNQESYRSDAAKKHFLGQNSALLADHSTDLDQECLKNHQVLSDKERLQNLNFESVPLSIIGKFIGEKTSGFLSFSPLDSEKINLDDFPGFQH